MGERKKILLNSSRSKEDENKVEKVGIELNTDNRNISEDTLTEIISSNVQFLNERSESNRYRLYGLSLIHI